MDHLSAALAMPLTVVRLTVPIDEIERRLGDSVTDGRQDDLRVTREWIAAGRGDDVGDQVIGNKGPIREAALQVVSALGR